MRLIAPVVFFPLLTFLAIDGSGQTLAGGQPSAAPGIAGSSQVAVHVAEIGPSQPVNQLVPNQIQATQAQVGLQARPAVPIGPDYRIGAGDVLRIAVWEEPQFTTSAVVRPDGRISMPLLSDLPVTGLTPDAAQHLLAEQLSRFVKRPQVTVIVEEIHSRIVYITGEVQRPGAYPLVGPMNVVQLIARSGGTSEFAKKKDVYVLHQEGGPKVRVNYQMLLAGKHLEENIGLIPGDTVVVP